MKPDERAPFRKSCDLFDDGSVMVYFTPSHSAGSVAIEVNDGGRFALFTGDNGYNRHSWEELRLPGPVYDLENMTKALEWVQERKQTGELRRRLRCT
jgi:N-acyl homoserine lactone hydrolase